jgi:hypothetical protein
MKNKSLTLHYLRGLAALSVLVFKVSGCKAIKGKDFINKINNEK